VQGYLFGVLSAFLSALAAVYTEWVMKRNNDSLYWQNMQLYTFGVAFNAFGLILADLRAGGLLLHTALNALTCSALKRSEVEPAARNIVLHSSA